jgi:hypothetical protein
MSRNRVEVVITATDQATPVLENLGRTAQGIGSGLISAGFDLASKAVGGFMSAVEKASDATTDNIMAVGSLASVMGSSYEIADKLNNKITKGLAQQAAALPGSTDDYVTVFRTVSDDVAGMSKELNGGKFSAQKFEGEVVKLTSKFTALKGSASIGEVTQGLQALLGGRKINQLNKLKFFRERNPVLKKNLEQLTKLAGQDLNEMNGGKRLEVILKALDMTLTDDTIAKMSATFDAVRQTFLTKLFDPSIGMFGLLRDVDGNLENGMQTAFGAITEALDSVIGEKGILMAFAGMMGALGFKGVDPMVVLRDGMLGFASFMRGIAGFFNRVKDLAHFNPGMAQDLLLSAPAKILAWLGGMISNVANGLRTTNFAGMANSLMPIISGVLSRIDWASFGGSLGELIASALIAVQNFLINFNWGGLLVIIGQLAIGLIQSIAGSLGATSAMMEAQWWAVVGQIGGLITTFIGETWTVMAFSFQQVMTQIGMFFTSLVSQVGMFALQALAFIVGGPLAGWVMGMTSTHSNLFNQIVAFFQGGAQQMLASAMAAVQGFVSGVTSAISSFFSSIQSAISSALGQAQAAVGSGGAMSAAAGSVAAGAAAMGGAATGFLPGTGLGGLLNAAMSEARAMPSGARLMMANSSEAILNRGQQGAMAGALAGGGGAMFAPQISVQAGPGMDVEALAAAVMGKIEGAWSEYQRGFLA